jgi:hypothetical protein
MVAVWNRIRRTPSRPVRLAEPHERVTGGEDATDPKELVAALLLWDAESVEATKAAEKIMAAAEARDDLADARDLAAVEREIREDLAQMLSSDADYGHDWPERRAAALDRECAKHDRVAARLDRVALAYSESPRLRGRLPLLTFYGTVAMDGDQRPVIFHAASWDEAIDLLHHRYGQDRAFVLAMERAVVHSDARSRCGISTL